MAGCSAEIGGVKGAGGFVKPDHPCFVEFSGSCSDQITFFLLKIWVILHVCVCTWVRTEEIHTHSDIIL